MNILLLLLDGTDHDNSHSQSDPSHDLAVALQELHPLVVAITRPDLLHHGLVVHHAGHPLLAAGTGDLDVLQPRARVDGRVLPPHLP